MIKIDFNAMTAVLPLPDGSQVFAEIQYDEDADVWCCTAGLERPTADPGIWNSHSEPHTCRGLYGEADIEAFMLAVGDCAETA